LYRQQDPHSHRDWYYQSLKALNRQVARISLFHSEIESLICRIKQTTHTEIEIKALIEQYKVLCREIEHNLAQDDLMYYKGQDHGRGYILVTKQYLCLWKMETHLFEMLYLLGPTFLHEEFPPESFLGIICATRAESFTHEYQIGYPTVVVSSGALSIDNDSPAQLPLNNILSHSQVLNWLDVSISRSTSVIRNYTLTMQKCDPFGVRRMAFLWRMQCAEAKKRGSVHKSWTEMESWLDDLLREDH